MGPAYFVLAIMGCGDGGAQCAEARVEPTRYVTAAQCQADLPKALARNTDLSFPVITAACRISGLRVAATARPSREG